MATGYNLIKAVEYLTNKYSHGDLYDAILVASGESANTVRLYLDSSRMLEFSAEDETVMAGWDFHYSPSPVNGYCVYEESDNYSHFWTYA